MDTSMLNAANNQPRLKVSLAARLIAAFAFTIPAIGGALGSLLLINLFRLLRANESAGMSAVMKGMKEASLPVIVSLYLAAICGMAVIIVLVVRMIIQTKTASPPFWFFVLSGILCFVPAGLFWTAQLLVLEVLSPGSSMGWGLSSVATYISGLLMMSVIAAVVVFILLVVASVLPLTSRAGSKWGSLVVATMLEFLFIATAVAIPFLIDGPKRKNEMVNLPVDVKYTDQDSDVEKYTSMVLTLRADNKLYQRQIRDLAGKVERTEAVITKEELPAKIQTSLEDKTPDKRIVYFKCDINASYENVLQVFDAIRKADVDRVGLVVVGEKTADDPYQIASVRFEVRLPGPIEKTASLRPNPLILLAKLENEGKLSLNNEDMGMVSDHNRGPADVGTVGDISRLENKLRQVFKAREMNGVFREGTNEIEKTVFLQASKSTKYGDFIKLVEAVKGSGAEPIGIQFDDVYLEVGVG
ncbi:MAG: biopolymer transporter ExbD [Acidobacteriota bacterium]